MRGKLKISNLKFQIFTFSCILYTLYFILYTSPIFAQPSTKSTNYEITWPNVNMGSGSPDSETKKLGITMGQNAPGLYTSPGNGYKVRAGFQYIHSIIPFSFRISSLSLAFGILTPEVLTNQKLLTFTVNSGSAGGYQVTAQENDPLTSQTGKTIVDTSCDLADTCTHTDSGTWTQTTTYGFGYKMTGTDVPSEFSGGKYKNFADAPGENPVKIMGKTIAQGHEAGKNKIATMSARINISTIQSAGIYRNILTFIATPTI